VHIETYAHVIESLSGERYADLGALIAGARSSVVFPQCSPAASTGDYGARRRIENASLAGSFGEALSRTRTGDPFLTMEVLYQLS
jgi:hypothetical protein